MIEPTILEMHNGEMKKNRTYIVYEIKGVKQRDNTRLSK